MKQSKNQEIFKTISEYDNLKSGLRKYDIGLKINNIRYELFDIPSERTILKTDDIKVVDGFLKAVKYFNNDLDLDKDYESNVKMEMNGKPYPPPPPPSPPLNRKR